MGASACGVGEKGHTRRHGPPRARSYIQFGDVGGDGDTPEVRLLDRLVRVLEEQRDPAALAHYMAHRGAAHDITEGVPIGLCWVAVPGDCNTDIGFRQSEV